MTTSDMTIEERTRRAYDANVATRERLTPIPWKLAERDAFVRMLVAEGARRVIEIGSGPGVDAVYMRDAGLEVVCTDISPAMADACRAKGFEAHAVSCLDLALDAASFDAAYAMNSLLHVPKADLPRVLDAIARVLKMDGLLYVGVWGGDDFERVWEEDSYDPPRFFSSYTDAHLIEVVSRVFDVVSFRSIAHPGDKDHANLQSLVLRKRSE
jgi:SAM-dependent methyltransferase